MAKQSKKTAVPKIKFRNKDVALDYNLYALIRLEEQGINLMNMEDGANELPFTDVIKFIYAGLTPTFSDVTVEEVANAYHLSDMKMLATAMNAGIKASTGE